MSLRYDPASEPLNIPLNPKPETRYKGNIQMLKDSPFFSDGNMMLHDTTVPPEREFFIDNLLVRIHFIIVTIRWTGLAPWEFEFPFPGSLTSTFLRQRPKASTVNPTGQSRSS